MSESGDGPYGFRKQKLPRGWAYPLKRSSFDAVLTECSALERVFTLRYLLAQHSAQGVVPERPLEVVFNPEGGGNHASGLVDVTLWAVPAAQRTSVASAIDEALPRLAAWIATTADRSETWRSESHGRYVEMANGVVRLAEGLPQYKKRRG